MARTVGGDARNRDHRRKQSLLAEGQIRSAARSIAAARGDTGRAEMVAELSDDPEFFFEACLSVARIDGGGVVPFRCTPGQKLLVDTVARDTAGRGYARVICLKSRRQGVTTAGQGLGYHKCSTQEQTNGLVAAHQAKSAAEIFRIARTFYDTDKRHKMGLAPQIRASNEHALRFANPDHRTRTERPGLQSNMLVETVGGKDVARGLTLQFFHGSEVAFWDNPDALAGIEVALSKTNGSIGILESTANGAQGQFYDIWCAAEEGKSEWVPLFLSWKIDPHCSSRVRDDERANWEWESVPERELAEKHSLSFEQVKWRREMLRSAFCVRPGKKPEDVFRQEYPLTPDEAFIATGRSYFLLEALREQEKGSTGARDPLWRGTLGTKTDMRRRPGTETKGPPLIVDRADPTGVLQVWEEPRDGEDYVVAVDPAEGLAHGDFSVALVLARRSLAFVAMVKTRALEADQLGEYVCLLAWWYRTALLGIELNGPGVTANTMARRAHYPRMWFDRDVTNESGEVRDRPGWRTSSGIRRAMLDDLEAELRAHRLGIPSKEFYREAQTFLLDDKGQPRAAIGKHDDEIMCAAIALQLHLRGGAMRGAPKPEAGPGKTPGIQLRPVKQKRALGYKNSWGWGE